MRVSGYHSAVQYMCGVGHQNGYIEFEFNDIILPIRETILRGNSQSISQNIFYNIVFIDNVKLNFN